MHAGLHSRHGALLLARDFFLGLPLKELEGKYPTGGLRKLCERHEHFVLYSEVVEEGALFGHPLVDFGIELREAGVLALQLLVPGEREPGQDRVAPG